MELKTTKKINGKFNVRQWKANTPRENWKMKGDDENIAFTTIFSELPPEFGRYARPFTGKDGDTLYAVDFKIGGKCRWFDGSAQPMERPSNADLDGKRWEACVQYREVVPKDESDTKAARGYWVNAIQVEEADTNPFTAFSDLTADNVAAGVITTEEQPSGDLPF